MSDNAGQSIVPIAVVLDERTGYTLWAPPWEEDDEEWQAFLGGDGRIHLFTSPRQLAHFISTANDHDLADHPDWPEMRRSTARQLAPDDDYLFDLDGVYELVAAGPDRWSVGELGDAIDMVSRMAECCDLDSVETTLAGMPDLALLDMGHEVFIGRAGERAWTKIATDLGEHWEPVLEALSGVLNWVEPVDLGDVPDDDTDDSADEPDEDADSVDDVVGATALSSGTLVGVDDQPTATEDEAAVAEFWESVGILPVQLIVPAGTGLTLRCYLEDSARFLGQELTVEMFASAEGLSSYIEEGSAHDLTGLATWGAVVEADADPIPAEEDSYDFVEIAELITGTSDMWDPTALAQAADAALDFAEYCRLERVNDLLGQRTELGQVVADARRGVGRSLRPTASQRVALSEAWTEIVTEISSCLRWHP